MYDVINNGKYGGLLKYFNIVYDVIKFHRLTALGKIFI